MIEFRYHNYWLENSSFIKRLKNNRKKLEKRSKKKSKYLLVLNRLRVD